MDLIYIHIYTMYIFLYTYCKMITIVKLINTSTLILFESFTKELNIFKAKLSGFSNNTNKTSWKLNETGKDLNCGDFSWPYYREEGLRVYGQGFWE